MRTHSILLLAAGLTLAACNDSGGPSTGGPPTHGTLVVSTSTGRDDPDQDGYLLTVDGVDSLALDPTGTVEIDLPDGLHELGLLGVAEHCSVAPGTPLEVDVPSQDTTSLAFEISCPATGARITTTTTGVDIDRDGYRVAVDGGDRGAISANGTMLIRLEPGSRTIFLTGLTPNCAVDGPGSRTVTIVNGEVALIEFGVGCTATAPGILALESSGDIYVADTNGSNLRRLTFDGGPYSYNREAAWSPDGSRIAFSKSDGRTGAGIYLINADGTNLGRLSPEGAYDASPTWSPDGARIAFENRSDNRSIGHIFAMNADGTNRVQLTSNRQPNSSPAWSPDGHRIAYATYSDTGDSGTHIYVMNADGTNRVRLTNNDAFDSDPEWSPDGGRIVFTRYPDLLVMDADGTNLVRLTPARSEPGRSGSPAWSPDGLMIAFTQSTLLYVDPWGDPHTQVGIWVLRLADGAMTELPLQVGRPLGPSWRP
jgi:TolB protein